MKELKPLQRHLELAGCLNLRELGGYETTEGKQIKWRTLLRSDSLHCLPPSSQQQLINYGIKTIIDLRSPFELETAEYAFSNRAEIKYFNLPLVEENHRNIIESIKDQTLLELNRFFLEERAHTIKTVLETIATQQIPVIIHCAVGKDRTGIITALLLAMAGVPITTIAEDYHLSERHLAPLYDRMRSKAVREGFTHLLESPPQTIIDTFTYLDRDYGGVNNYLKNIGLNLEISDRLKMMLTKEK
ncbi:tyrosine-protein phosphatase [Hyella patelloides]|nr:tyrosine-protein phosphatase [Hyella patelloides]